MCKLPDISSNAQHMHIEENEEKKQESYKRKKKLRKEKRRDFSTYRKP